MKVERLGFGVPSLDDLMGGGIETSTITELFGEAGSGKTNACLLLSRNVVRSGKKVIFIDTEGVSLERLHQVCQNVDFDKVSKDILFFEAHDYDQQEDAVNKAKSLCKSGLGAGLVVVDSMTIFYRALVSSEGMEIRHRLGRMANTLLNIGREYEVPVLITTQVYHDPETNSVHPIGGHVLAHQAKAIIKLEKLNKGIRRARIVKHRSVPSGREALFKIDECGFCECAGSP